MEKRYRGGVRVMYVSRVDTSTVNLCSEQVFCSFLTNPRFSFPSSFSSLVPSPRTSLKLFTTSQPALGYSMPLLSRVSQFETAPKTAQKDGGTNPKSTRVDTTKKQQQRSQGRQRCSKVSATARKARENARERQRVGERMLILDNRCISRQSIDVHAILPLRGGKAIWGIVDFLSGPEYFFERL